MNDENEKETKVVNILHDLREEVKTYTNLKDFLDKLNRLTDLVITNTNICRNHKSLIQYGK